MQQTNDKYDALTSEEIEAKIKETYKKYYGLCANISQENLICIAKDEQLNYEIYAPIHFNNWAQNKISTSPFLDKKKQPQKFGQSPVARDLFIKLNKIYGYKRKKPQKTLKSRPKIFVGKKSLAQTKDQEKSNRLKRYNSNPSLTFIDQKNLEVTSNQRTARHTANVNSDKQERNSTIYTERLIGNNSQNKILNNSKSRILHTQGNVKENKKSFIQNIEKFSIYYNRKDKKLINEQKKTIPRQKPLSRKKANCDQYYKDSQYSNQKHQRQHLHNTYALQNKNRINIIKQISKSKKK